MCQQVDFIDFSRIVFKYSAHHTSSMLTELFHFKENTGRAFPSHHAGLISGSKSVMCIVQPWQKTTALASRNREGFSVV